MDRQAIGTAKPALWVLPMPAYARMTVRPTEPNGNSKLAFSALPADLAREAKPIFRRGWESLPTPRPPDGAGCAASYPDVDPTAVLA